MTGTRDFNIKGMKKFEDEVYNYLKENQTNHVLYRVTPYNALENTINKRQNKNEESNVMEEYNRYERRKVFLDNKSWKGNDFAWVMDEGSVCISEHGDGGPYAISDIDLPKNANVGDVYEKIDGKYIYNSDITSKLKEIM